MRAHAVPGGLPGHELSCREFVEFLDAYLNGELAEGSRIVFDRHLEACPDCRNYLDSYRVTVRLGRLALRDEERLPETQIPEELVRAILETRG